MCTSHASKAVAHPYGCKRGSERAKYRNRECKLLVVFENFLGAIALEPFIYKGLNEFALQKL